MNKKYWEPIGGTWRWRVHSTSLHRRPLRRCWTWMKCLNLYLSSSFLFSLIVFLLFPLSLVQTLILFWRITLHSFNVMKEFVIIIIRKGNIIEIKFNLQTLKLQLFRNHNNHNVPASNFSIIWCICSF